MKTWSTDFLQSKYEIKELVLCLSEICRSFLAMMHTLGRDRQICSDLTVLILLPWLLDVAMHLTFLSLFIVLAMLSRSHLMLSTLPCFWDKITLSLLYCASMCSHRDTHCFHIKSFRMLTPTPRLVLEKSSHHAIRHHHVNAPNSLLHSTSFTPQHIITFNDA